MPRQRKNELVREKFFSWKMYTRNDVYYADGRSNKIDLGRHSLGTRNRSCALRRLEQLDEKKAVQHGLVKAAAAPDAKFPPLSISDGIRKYLSYIGRPRVTGGASKATQKRYRAVLEKFQEFAVAEGIHHWQEVDGYVLDLYAGWLENTQGHAYATCYLELTTLKQVNKWLVKGDRQWLPDSCLITKKLRKPSGHSDRYCFTESEVDDILRYCGSCEELRWLRPVVLVLAYTGMRIGELRQLRWEHVDCERGMLRIVDNTGTARTGQIVTSTKNRTSRSVPMSSQVQQVLKDLPRSDDGYVFHGPRGGRLSKDTVLGTLKKKVLRPLAKRFPPQNGSARGMADGCVHSFRHFFCSKCARDGVPEMTVRDWLGHKSSEVTRHYFHQNDSESTRLMKRLKPLDGENESAPESHGKGDGERNE